MAANLPNGILLCQSPHSSEVSVTYLLFTLHKCTKNNTIGSDINLDCNINNFPPMQKAKAITVSLIRLVYKTSSAK